MTISSIHLKNFQSHKDTMLELHPNVNVIIGKSDSGKTALIRGLRFNCDNRPVGDSFRSRWGGDTQVGIKLSEMPHEIIRLKSDTKNQYIVGKEKFKALGLGGPPSEIAEVFNLLSLNVQYQMDPPFLFSQTPGSIAQYLNDIAHLDEIDITIGNINSRITGLKSKLALEKQNLSENEKKFSKFDYLPSLEKDIEAIEALSKELSSLTQDYEYLLSLSKEIRDLQSQLEISSRLQIADRSIQRISSKIQNYETMDEQLQQLSALLSDIDSIESKLSANEIAIRNLESWWHRNAPKICPLCKGKGKLK